MTITMRPSGEPDELLRTVEQLSGQSLAGCYQCGTCAATCPLRGAMDLGPDAIIGQLRFGMPGVLDRQTFWVCVGCDGCVERCPRAIDIARIMGALRQIHIQEHGDRLAVSQLPDEARRRLPPIAMVASMRRNTG